MTPREAAESYAGALEIGDRIIESVDACIIDEFRHLIPAVLAKRGLILREVRDGQEWIVAIAPWKPAALRPVIPVACIACGRSWFDPDCEHGTKMVISLGAPTLPASVCKVAQG